MKKAETPSSRTYQQAKTPDIGILGCYMMACIPLNAVLMGGHGIMDQLKGDRLHSFSVNDRIEGNTKDLFLFAALRLCFLSPQETPRVTSTPPSSKWPPKRERRPGVVIRSSGMRGFTPRLRCWHGRLAGSYTSQSI